MAGLHGTVTGEAESAYTAINSSKTYGAEGGSETSIEKTGASGTVDVPLTSEDDPETEEDDTTATVTGNSDETPVVTGDEKESPKDGDYDYTTTTVTGQSSVSVTTKEITVTETVGPASEMEYLTSDAEPNGGSNHLLNVPIFDAQLPAEGETVETTEDAMEALAELTGRRVREDVTNRIFERFCVGK